MIHLVSFLFLVGAAPAPGPNTPRVMVAPLAVLSAGVPPKASAKAQAMLKGELLSTGAFDVVEPRLPGAHDEAAQTLIRARAAFDEAKALWAKKKLALADEALGRAREAYAAGATALVDVGELVDAYALASAVAYTSGRDDDGLRLLSKALALAPDRELLLAKTSPLFARVVAQTLDALKAGPKGALKVSSTPTNAPVTVDGRAMGVTPLAIAGVPPGPHVWAVTLSTGETAGGVIEVAPGRTTEVVGKPTRPDAWVRLLSALAQNQLDHDAVLAGQEVARANTADFVVLGALSATGSGLALDAFLLSAETGALRRLPRRQFDLELLSAGMELYGMAGELAAQRSRVGEAVTVPARVSSAGSVERKAEVSYGGEAVRGDVVPETSVKPAEPRRRVPLKAR